MQGTSYGRGQGYVDNKFGSSACHPPSWTTTGPGVKLGQRFYIPWFCYEVFTPEGRGGEKGGSANFKTKHTEPLTQKYLDPCIVKSGTFHCTNECFYCFVPATSSRIEGWIFLAVCIFNQAAAACGAACLRRKWHECKQTACL